MGTSRETRRQSESEELLEGSRSLYGEQAAEADEEHGDPQGALRTKHFTLHTQLKPG